MQSQDPQVQREPLSSYILGAEAPIVWSHFFGLKPGLNEDH